MAVLTQKELKELGAQVADALLIGRKRNAAGIAKAKVAFPKAEAFLKKFDGKVLSKAQLEAAGVNAKALKALSSPQCGPIIAKRGKNYAVRATIGESVRLLYHPDNWSLAKEIVLACMRKGAHVSATPHYSAFDREAVAASPMARLEDLPQTAVASAKTLDVSIYLECEDDPAWKAGMSAAKLQAGQDNAQFMHQIMDARKVRWLVLGWSFATTAKRYGISPQFYEKMLLTSLKESFSKSTRGLVMYYKNALEGGNLVRITHDDGTDISFRIKGPRGGRGL